METRRLPAGERYCIASGVRLGCASFDAAPGARLFFEDFAETGSAGPDEELDPCHAAARYTRVKPRSFTRVRNPARSFNISRTTQPRSTPRKKARSRARASSTTGSPSTSSPCSARSEEHTSERQHLNRISYAVSCLKKNNNNTN